MSVLLNALNKAAHQQHAHSNAKKALKLDNAHYHSSQLTKPSKQLTESSIRSLSVRWLRVAAGGTKGTRGREGTRGTVETFTSSLLQQGLVALQKKVYQHRQQLARYYQAFNQYSPTEGSDKENSTSSAQAAIFSTSNTALPQISTRLLTEPSSTRPSIEALEQLFQRVNPSQQQPRSEISTLGSAICLAGLCALGAIIWQQDLQIMLTSFDDGIASIDQPLAHPTKSIVDTKTVANSQLQETTIAPENNSVRNSGLENDPLQNDIGEIEPDLSTINTNSTQQIEANNAEIQTMKNLASYDVPIIFVEPRIPPRITITKNKSSDQITTRDQDNANPVQKEKSTNDSRQSPSQRLDAQSALQEAQYAWSRRDKRAAALSLGQYWQLVNQQPLAQQTLESGFDQLYRNGYYELAFYLLQADLQQSSLPSIKIYQLFKLIPELPLETLAPFFINLSHRHPENSFIYFGLGNLYALHRHWQPALTQFRLVTRYDPKNADAYFNTAISAEYLHKYDESINAYQQAIVLTKQRSFSFPLSIANERLEILKKRSLKASVDKQSSSKKNSFSIKKSSNRNSLVSK